MASLAVERVMDRKQKRAFVDLPRQIYRDDPNWVPPLWGMQQELLGWKHHPFYAQAESQCFVAWANGKPVGRVAAILNHAHNDYYKERRGFFGFFECIDDVTVARALFDAVHVWFKERGIANLRGPANPSMNYECGLLVEGFDGPPTFMMTYNPPYYAALIEQCGFSKSQDLLAFLGKRAQLTEVGSKLGNLARQSREKCGAAIRPLDRKRFVQDVEAFLGLYNTSFQEMWGFVPISQAELAAMAASLKHLVIPELAFFAEVEGRTVGAVLGLPDYNPVIKRIGGNLYPFGFLRLLWSKRSQLRKVRIISINVVSEFQRWGLGIALLAAMVPKGLEMGLQEAEFSWIAESNEIPVLGLQKGGAQVYRKYRMYDSDEPKRLTSE